MNSKIAKIVDELKTLTLLEASDLVKEIENTFGVDTSIAVSPMVGNIGNMGTINNAQNVEAVEEKTTFDIMLTEVPADKKIAVLKIIRNVTGLGLKESKDIVDNVPKLVKEGVSKEESENIKKELEAAGSKVNIK